MKLGIKIKKVMRVDLEDFVVRLRFSNDVIGSVSLNNIFSKPKNLAAEVLKGGMFKKCFVESGALAWPNGLELCPDAVYQWFLQQKKRAAA